jgi:hypothetical protein
MNKLFLFIVMLLLNCTILFAQVSINTDGTAPDSSAMLDVKSVDRGFLPPRMTQNQMNAIVNPASGLIVFCIDCGHEGSGAIATFLNGIWYLINITCLNPAPPVAGAHVPSSSQIIWNWNAISGASGYKWNTINDYGSANDLGTDTAKTETGLGCNTSYTRYLWAYSNCGASMATTLTQATAINPIAPDTGTHIPLFTQIVWKWVAVSGAAGYKWNTTDDYYSAIDMGTSLLLMETGLTCYTNYTRYVWAYNSCGNSTATPLTQATSRSPVNVPAAGTNVPYLNSIVWNWNTASGATGYKWSTINDFASASDMDSDTTKTETGLTYGTSYTRYVWAYNNCEFSTPVSLTQSTLSFTCGDSIIINHLVSGSAAPVDKTVTYGTVTNIPGASSKCWITSNLGADHQATAVNDATEASAGWYWQFNRMQGYKHDGTTLTPAWTITSISENSNWLSANNPCTLELGNGWRLPTSTEWTNVDAIGGWTNWNGPWNSALKMHGPGYLHTDGSLLSRGSGGIYWSSTQVDNSYGRYLGLSSGDCQMSYYFKSSGFSARCLRD